MFHVYKFWLLLLFQFPDLLGPGLDEIKKACEPGTQMVQIHKAMSINPFMKWELLNWFSGGWLHQPLQGVSVQSVVVPLQSLVNTTELRAGIVVGEDGVPLQMKKI